LIFHRTAPIDSMLVSRGLAGLATRASTPTSQRLENEGHREKKEKNKKKKILFLFWVCLGVGLVVLVEDV